MHFGTYVNVDVDVNVNVNVNVGVDVDVDVDDYAVVVPVWCATIEIYTDQW